MPGSPAPAPCSRHCKPIMLLPLPAPPLTSVRRPAGTPPPNTRSTPAMPVGTFGISFLLFCNPAASLPCALRAGLPTVPPLFFVLFFPDRLCLAPRRHPALQHLSLGGRQCVM